MKKIWQWLAGHRKTSILLLVLLAGYLVLLAKTWPVNWVATCYYKLQGKPAPGEEMRKIRQFLKAKRLVDKQEYADARKILEKLWKSSGGKFPFAADVPYYLGFVYDVQQEYAREEQLYRELEQFNAPLSRFMWALYHERQGKRLQARGELRDALRLDAQNNGLGEHRKVAMKLWRNWSSVSVPKK